MVLPRTGKTHQIRVALKSLGAPILGDRLYAGTPADRVYLHAWRLCFPFRGESLRFESLPAHGDQFMALDTLPALRLLVDKSALS